MAQQLKQEVAAETPIAVVSGGLSDTYPLLPSDVVSTETFPTAATELNRLEQQANSTNVVAIVPVSDETEQRRKNAEVAKIEAEVAKLDAEAEKTRAEAIKTRNEATKTEAETDLVRLSERERKFDLRKRFVVEPTMAVGGIGLLGAGIYLVLHGNPNGAILLAPGVTLLGLLVGRRPTDLGSGSEGNKK